MDEYSYKLYSKIVSTGWKVFLIILSIAAVIAFFPYVRNIFLMFVISLFLATLLAPFVNFLEKVGLPSWLSILINIFFIIGLIVFGMSRLVPGLINTIQALSRAFQSDILLNVENSIRDFLPEPIQLPNLSERIASGFNNIVINLISRIGSFVKNAGSIVATIGIIPLITFFLLKDKNHFKRKIVSLLPNKYFELGLNIIHKTSSQLSNYIVGISIQSVIIASLSIFGLSIINHIFQTPVPPFIIIGIIAGVANMVPYLGPIAGALPALIIASMNVNQNVFTVLFWIAIVFFIVQILDNTLVRPLVLGSSVNLHPIFVITVVIIGGNIAGIFGMLLAIPITGIIKVTISQIIWGLKNYKLN